MNPDEVAADLDDKSVKILQLLLHEGRDLRDDVSATLSTPTVKREYGWTNQTILRRFRKLRDAGLVTLSEVPEHQPEHDRYPRPPKQIELTRRVTASDIRQILIQWDSREARSPAQLTDDLDDIDHRIDAIDDRLTNRIDAIQSKQNSHLRQHALIDRRDNRFQKRIVHLVPVAVVVYIILVAVILFTLSGVFASILASSISAILGAVIGSTFMHYNKS